MAVEKKMNGRKRTWHSHGNGGTPAGFGAGMGKRLPVLARTDQTNTEGARGEGAARRAKGHTGTQPSGRANATDGVTGCSSQTGATSFR